MMQYPTQQLIDNRNKFLAKEEEIKNYVASKDDIVALHLGCGNKIFKGFSNID